MSNLRHAEPPPATLLLALLGFSMMCAKIGHIIGCENLKQEAVEHGSAEYDSKTKEFRWLSVVERYEHD